MTFDPKNVFLTIGSASYSGEYVRQYMNSFANTVAYLRDLGLKLDWLEFPYCADIGLARARLVGEFLRRKEGTHLLQIDSDMGWNPQDITKMFGHEKDFIAVAGPRKTSKLEFAASIHDDGLPQNPVSTDDHTELFEVTAVGGAFVLNTRSCLQSIWDAHPELEFRSAAGTTERGIYDPSYHNGIRFSEDYAVCRRWRALGGKVFVMPFAHMSHVGINVWEGALGFVPQLFDIGGKQMGGEVDKAA